MGVFSALFSTLSFVPRPGPRFSPSSESPNPSPCIWPCPRRSLTPCPTTSGRSLSAARTPATATAFTRSTASSGGGKRRGRRRPHRPRPPGFTPGRRPTRGRPRLRTRPGGKRWSGPLLGPWPPRGPIPGGLCPRTGREGRRPHPLPHTGSKWPGPGLWLLPRPTLTKGRGEKQFARILFFRVVAAKENMHLFRLFLSVLFHACSFRSLKQAMEKNFWKEWENTKKTKLVGHFYYFFCRFRTLLCSLFVTSL